MNGTFEVGAVALRAQQAALETIANNIANMNTPAFKRVDISYSEIVGSGSSVDGLRQGSPGARPELAGGVRMSPRSMISMQGELRLTSNELDLAIDGKGFVELMAPEGESVLWRGGRLEIGREGLLGTEGLPLKALISVPEDAIALSIDRGGVVVATLQGGEEVEIGQIGLVGVENDAALERLGSGHYAAGDDVKVYDLVAGQDGAGEFAQAMVEESNVDFSAALVELLTIQRAYAASTQIIQAADQLASLTNNLKR